MNQDDKTCPRCAETIKSAAVVCRYCGHEFDKAVGKPSDEQKATVGSVQVCKKCKKVFASSYSSCPHCKGGIGKGCLIISAIILAVAVLASMCAPENGGPNTSSQNAVPEAQSCKNSWAKCRDNEDLVENYSRWVNIQVACKMEANDRAKYGTPEWPWLPFGTYLQGDAYPKTGMAIAIEKDVQFQNGFGAMVHSRVVCGYDLKSEKVVSVEIESR